MLLKSKVIFTALSVLSLALGLLLQFILADKYAGNLADAFFLVITISGVVITMSTSGMNSFLIANFELDGCGGKDVDILNVTVLFIAIFSVIAIIISIIIFFVSSYLFKLNGLDSVFFSFTSFFYIIALSVNIVFQSYSYCHRGYKGVVAYEVINVIIFCLTILFIHEYINNFILCLIFFCFRPVIQQCIYFYIIKKDIRNNCFSLKKIKIIFHEMKLLMGGGAYYKSEPVVDRLFLIKEIGGISAYHLISQIYTAVLGVWFKVAISPLIRELKENVSSGRDVTTQIFRAISIQAGLAILGGCILFYTPLLSYLFKIPIFSIIEKNTQTVYILYAFFVACLFGQIVSSCFYVFELHKFPIVVSCITFTLFIPLKYLVIGKFGIIGLSVLVSMYHAINAVILSYFLVKVIKCRKF